jgi:MFS family permease
VSGQTADKEAVTTRIPRSAILAMVALCSAVFVAALDQTMVLTLMNKIMVSLGIDVEHIGDAGWIVTGYLLGYTIAMPLFGRLADVKGRRPMAMVALALFLVGSGLCVLFDRLGLFVAARVIQAAGGGALVPIAMAAAADMFPLGRRALVLGIVGGAAEAGGVLGPLYGVGLNALWYWRLIFIVNIPLCLILMVVCWRLLRHDRTLGQSAASGEETDYDSDGPTAPAAGARTRWWHRGQVDYLGAVLMALALAGITIGLGTGTQTVNATTADKGSPVSWPWLAVCAVALVTFVLYERKHPHPLIRLDFFKRPAFAAANISNFLLGAALIIGMVEIPLYAYTLFDLSELQAGLLLIQLTIPIPIGAVVGGWVADRIGSRITGVLGFLIAAGGYLLVSRWSIAPGFWTKLVDLAISGFGFGLVIGPIGASVTSSVGSKWMATGSALVTVSRMVGMAVGLSAVSAWGVRRFNALAASSTVTVLRTPDMNDVDYQIALSKAITEDSLHHVFNEFFLIAAIIVALAAIPALFFYKHKTKDVEHPSFLPY